MNPLTSQRVVIHVFSLLDRESFHEVAGQVSVDLVGNDSDPSRQKKSHSHGARHKISSQASQTSLYALKADMYLQVQVTEEEIIQFEREHQVPVYSIGNVSNPTRSQNRQNEKANRP